MSDAQHDRPVLAQVYLATGQGHEPEGTPAFYVRTEQRSGRRQPEHLLIYTRGRVVFERWEDPAHFAERWALDYTPPVDPLEAHEVRRERDALVATFRELESFVVDSASSQGLDGAAGLADSVLAKARLRFTFHRDAA